ncbi:MAG TPA: bifunctional alpha,alpha-trehalose-phosphate synthase (UDP-forming)/trehalose-phosphatase [Flavisolibacter sp.]
MPRLIIVSNRLPFAVENQDGEITVRQSSGGLVSAIKSYIERNKDYQQFTGRVWIGSMDCTEEDWQAAVNQGLLPEDLTVQPIFPESAAYANFYNGFSNSVLWPLFHYFPSLVEYRKEFFKDYKRINQQFADAIRQAYEPGDVIWIHDYQLMMVSDMLRRVLPDATIGFFLHIPFPSYEIFRLLPREWKQQILQGVMGADLIGFHTHDYGQHFIQSVKMILQVDSQFNTVYYGNRMVRIDQFPIGIDYKKFRDACIDETVVGICTRIEENFYNQKIIFSVDRLDYTKGISYRLSGFEHFLENHPEFREKIVFILNIVPSRDTIYSYNEMKKSIELQVSTINGRFSTLQWQPIIYRYNHLEFEELCALYQAADVALITPLRDGMNLVAKEFIASCIDKGVLILSELTGAASELNEAVLVNPTDTDEVANAIYSALMMPLIEQRSRLSYMQRRIAEYDVQKWINDFMDQLIITKKDQESLKVNILKENHIEQIVADFNKANKRCILLDYDGTLAPYQKLPSMAAPSEDLIQLLKQLTQDPSNEIVIISGRDINTLEKWLGKLPLNMIAEHGACAKYHGEDWKEQVSINTEWKEQIRPLMQLFVDRCAGSFIEEKKSTLAWHYRNTNQELGFMRSRELRNALLQLTANTALQVVDGNKVLEVRMVGVDKGMAAVNMISGFEPDFVLCIGDDVTDEDMFRAMRDKGYTIKIGRANTSAQYTILSQKEVFPFLQRFVQPIEQKNVRYS